MARVVVIGGGYGGASVARQLDDVADVVLVEPKDAFVHAVAALRAVVDVDWQDRVFFPYDQLLRRGRVVHDWARSVSPGIVRLSTTEVLAADFVVLATGTGYPFPAKFLENQRSVASARLARMREELLLCDRVLVVGGGPVGLELAGELTSAIPDLAVTVVDQAEQVLGTPEHLPELGASVRRQLEDRGVTFELGAPLAALPPFDVGRYGPFSVPTTAGTVIDAQMWFRCYGARPLTDYLDPELSALRRGDGTLRVTRHLSLAGQDRVFAVGDITDVPESKRATAALDHADVVARNIRDLIDGRTPSAVYLPAPERLVLPLGPTGGASQLGTADGERVVVGADETVRIKGMDLFSDATAQMLGLDPAATPTPPALAVPPPAVPPPGTPLATAV